ncbi:beta-class carbonic anhydrase [Brevibacillus dissolubilis]|uniref:beta-class carbonic anhydrase n=1 Tax=Brevibacillus dissolubilis TaxID=1844116 RepID=UPI0011164A7F|nr:carbonic anhydrase [Brevibacillus dissolubilis]
MTILSEILSYNHEFVETKEYEKYSTTKFPDKKMVIVSCMDTRLTELLPRALNLRNGDAKIIKNAGAVIAHPFGSIMRSIIVAVYELNAEEVILIGHHGCGMGSINPTATMAKMRERGIREETMQTLLNSGLKLEQWLHGFDCVVDSVRAGCETISNHPLLPPGIPVHGLVIDPDTGKLDLIVDGYKEVKKVEEEKTSE